MTRLDAFFGSRRAAWVVATACVLALGFLSTQRTPISKVWADEGTFLAMAASLAEDGDLLFTEADLDRLDLDNPARASLILERTEKGIAFSKPITLPLLAAPFWALFGDAGLVILNALALLAALLLAHRHLERLTPATDGRPLWTTITFALAAVVVPYVFWRMADLLQLALSLAGLVLCFGLRRRAPDPHLPRSRRRDLLDRVLDHPAAPYLGVCLVALTVNMRLTNGALVMIPVLADLFHRRWGRAITKGACAASTVLAVAGLTWLLTGALDPYRAERTSFLPVTGYPAGPDAEVAAERFDTLPATHYVHPHPSRWKTAYSFLYFFVGRHSGLLLYFPAALLFLLVWLRRPDRLGAACVLGIGVVVTYFLVSKPDNYFGGATFLGNRYFLSMYPAFLLLLGRLPSARSLAAVWLLAAGVYGSSVASVARVHGLETGSQSHARAGLFRLLPFESTAISLDGTRGQYWAGQFVRFVDPFAEVSKLNFRLRTGRPATEVQVAHWRPQESLRYLVEADAPDVTLVVEDWRGTHRYRVGSDLASPGGLVGIDIGAARPWRYHGYWFERQRPFWTQVFTLRLEGPEGASARFHHLGDLENTYRAFAYEPLGIEAPSLAVVDTVHTVLLRVRNTSPVYWEAQDATALTVRYRLWRGEEKVFESGRLEIPERVAPGEVLEMPVEIRWPERSGTVGLEVDLVLEQVDWFQNRLGDPVVRAEVELLDPR